MFRALSLPYQLAVLAGVLSLLVGGVYAYGWSQYSAGQRDLVAKIAADRAASIEEAERIEDEIQELDNDELLDAALGYVRGSGG